MSLDEAELAQYHAVRQHLRRLHKLATARMTNTTLQRAGRKLGVMEGRTLYLNDGTEQVVFMDYCVYSVLDRGRSTVQKMLANLPPATDPTEQLARDAMSNTRYSLFDVVDTEPGHAVYVYDRIRGGAERFRVIDIAMSKTVDIGTTLASRVLALGDHWMFSGAGFMIPTMMADAIQTGHTYPPPPDLRSPDDPPIDLSPELQSKLATDVIMMALAEGWLEHMRYGESPVDRAS